MLMSVMLVGVISLFMTSCVQGDLCDEFYDDLTISQFQRHKRSKDYGIYPNDIEYFKNADFVNGECVAFAVSLACPENSHKDVREAIIKLATGKECVSRQDWEAYLSYVDLYETGSTGTISITPDDWYTTCVNFGRQPTGGDKSSISKLLKQKKLVFGIFPNHIANITAVSITQNTPVVEVYDPNTANGGGGNPGGMGCYLISNSGNYALLLSDVKAVYYF